MVSRVIFAALIILVIPDLDIAYGQEGKLQVDINRLEAALEESSRRVGPPMYGQLSDLDDAQLSALPGDLKDAWLSIAALNGHADNARRLLAADADVNARSEGGWTPLLLALLRGHTELAIFFLSHGADSTLVTDDGITVDDLALVSDGKSLGLSQQIQRVSARSSCGDMVTAYCPSGYELVGGGIDMENVDSNGATCTSWSNHLNNEYHLHGIVTKPNSDTSGWKCRADDRKVDCYAMCIQRDPDGISTTKRVKSRIQGQKSGCGDNCPDSAFAACPSGYTVMGGGMELTMAWQYRNQACCKQSDVEELKRDFAYYVSGNGVQCKANSPDHWGNCYALCVSDVQLANVDVVIKSLSSESKKSERACGSDQDLIGCGFRIDDGGDDRITRIRCKPSQGNNEASCRVRAISKSKEMFPWEIEDNEIKCQAYCLRF